MHEKPDQHEALNHIHTSVFGRLDRDFVNLYNQHAAETPDKPIDLGVLRTKYSQLYAYGTAPAPEPSKVFDSEVPGYAGARLAVRVYQPDIPGPWPVHMNFHGGGWALGDLDTESHICKHYCVKAKVNVIDIAYRLIPEAPFPTGILDSFEALKYVYENGADVFGINSSRISLGAVSAGGNIALILAHLARDSGIPLQLVTAGTPVIDDISTYETPEDSPFPSMTEMEHAPTLNWMRLEWFDNLKWHSYQTILQYGRTSCDKWNLCKTVIYTAECDPLRDEGEAYARKLIESGNEVVVRRFLGVPHPFMHMDFASQQAREFIDMTAQELRQALHD